MQQQYRRWKWFAMRMAHRGLRLRTQKSRLFVAGCIRDFFGELDRTIELSKTQGGYLDGLLERIKGWDSTESHPTWRSQYGHPSNGPYVCDMVSGWDESWNPHYWSDDNAAYERWDKKWGSRIRCCLRAGIDLASEPSMGVAGFTAGDLRRMYKGRVPDWITGGPDHHWTEQQFVGEIPGIGLVPGECKLNGTFAEMADEQSVWL